MIYNWDQENVDLFIGSNSNKEETPEEKASFEIFCRNKDQMDKNAKKLTELMKSFGWTCLDGSHICECCFDGIHNKNFGDKNSFFHIDVLDKDYERIEKQLIEINEKLKKIDLKEEKTHIGFNNSTGHLKVCKDYYFIKEDYDPEYDDYHKLELVEYYDWKCYTLGEFEEIKELKEFPKLYDYLKKHEKCFWQVRNKKVRLELFHIIKELGSEENRIRK